MSIDNEYNDYIFDVNPTEFGPCNETGCYYHGSQGCMTSGPCIFEPEEELL